MGKRLRKITLWIILTVCCCAVPTLAYAADENQVPDLIQGQESQLTVLLQEKINQKTTQDINQDEIENGIYNESPKTIPIDGAAIVLAQVAQLQVQNGAAIYDLTAQFLQTGVSFDGMTTQESLQAAQLFLDDAVDQDLSFESNVTNEQGLAKFEHLNPGIYLVAQMGASAAAENYYPIRPFLVTVPMLVNQDGESQWNYDVLAEPKTEITPKETPTPTVTDSPTATPTVTVTPTKTAVNVKKSTTTITKTTNVKTGDESNAYFYSIVGIASILLLVGAILGRKLQRKE